MTKQSHKIEYEDAKGKKNELYFVDRAFDSALKQAEAFIKRHEGSSKVNNIKLYWRDLNGPYNFGWKRLHLALS